MKYIGHSANDEGYEQLYKDHVINVRDRALRFFEACHPFFKGSEKEWNCLWNTLYLSTTYHDLGKLDAKSQEIMHDNHDSKKGKMVNHVDAGVSYLINRFQSSSKIEFLYAAILVSSHHRGIMNEENLDFPALLKNMLRLRDSGKVFDRNERYIDLLLNQDEMTMDYTDRHLEEWVKIHNNEVGFEVNLMDSSLFNAVSYPLTLRLLLSCLAEGDHYDTSDHYGLTIEITPSPLKAKERLSFQLEERKSFKAGDTQEERERNQIRNSVFRDCMKAPLGKSFYHLCATPGNAKTQGGDALSKRIAINTGVRRIFKISPFSNIIIQNVKEIKKFNILPGEKEDEIVGEHHHQSDYFEKAKISNILYRRAKELNTLWKCPIEFTSSVQFFETMASNWPSKLRKFSMVPGSVVEIDEYHTCVPLNKIRQTFLWMKELSEFWSCTFIFMSGSPIKFWDIEELNSCEIKREEVCEILSKKTINIMESFEKKRIKLKTIKTLLSIEALIRFVTNTPGPRVVICNTVLTAAIVANRFRLSQGKDKVMHLSTALSPNDRNKLYDEISKKLQDTDNDDWTLVATSCIDTGVNFSFVTGFRETNSLMSSLQLGGRVNRDGEKGDTCDIFDFKLDHALEGTTNNPSFFPAMRVFDKMTDMGKVSYSNCSEAIDREVKERNLQLKEVEKYEKVLNYHEVANRYKLITAHYKTVVVDHDIMDRLMDNEFVHPKEIMQNSVQFYYTKLERGEYSGNIETYEYSDEVIEKQKAKKIRIKNQNNYSLWCGCYCPYFLGYMKEILKIMGENVNY